ncbi:MAG: flagellar biosynthesis anti-sigma factor FlgM [bacterium]
MKINSSIINRLMFEKTSSGEIDKNMRSEDKISSSSEKSGDKSGSSLKISKEAEILEMALEIMNRTPEVEEKRVAEISTAIKDGSYTIETADVAAEITKVLKGE